jgi:hypothetical protein
LKPDPQSNLTINYSLIGTGITPTTGANNISTNTPLLGPLADHGGPTKTHALLPGSPALDAGDPNFDVGNFSAPGFAGPLAFDQRGDGFARLVDGGGPSRPIIDIGAYESQGVHTGFPAGDFNQNGIADGGDYVVWRKGVGIAPTQENYNLWRTNFGNTTVPTAVPAAIPLILPLGGPAGDDGIANSTEPLGSNGLGVSQSRPEFLVTSATAVANGRPAANGLPNDGFFPATAVSPDIQLLYRDTNNGDNTLRLAENTANPPQVTIDVPDGAYAQLDLAVMSGDGTSSFQVDLHYADGTSDSHTSQALDWFNEPSPIPQAIGDGQVYYLRDGMDRFAGGFYENVADPAVFGVRFAVNAGKTLESITVTQLGNTPDGRTQVLNILGGAVSEIGPPGSGASAGPEAVVAKDAVIPSLAAEPIAVAAQTNGSYPQSLAAPSLPITAPRRGVLAAQMPPASQLSDALLLALDQALTDFDSDPGQANSVSDIDDQPAEQGGPSQFDDSLAVALVEWL